ncbi:LemA family protein [Aurantibacter sp.]|uniref:LemA family protein n=1 Tax=Aurantibacter sp. TaxID=2807103 RepID=UPI0035C79866
MKKFLIPIVVIALLGIWIMNSYNGLVGKEENVSESWAKVESAYQRRTDLYSNIVKTVQASADFERKTLNEVIEARSRATSIEINVDDLTPENIAKFQNAQSQFSGRFSRLLATFERYPDLKTTGAFKEFMAQQEGTENRINVARDRFNESAKLFNVTVRKFPATLIASTFGFEKKAYFEAEEGSEKAPDVNFEF